MRVRTRLVAAVVAIAALAAVGTVGGAAVRNGTERSAAACPPGYELLAAKEAAERRGGIREVETLHQEVLANGTCINAAKHPEKLIELILRQEGIETARSAPYETVAPGAFAAALEDFNSRFRKSTSKVSGTEGTWQQYGRGPLQVDHPDYSQVNGLGLVDNMGRLDSLEYDAATNRLFAAKGTGGVWLSEDLGSSWRSIGDSLPSQIVGAVGYTPANGGTVIAVSGDGTFGAGGYTGFGAFYSTNLGSTWTKAAGVPNGALGFAIEADPANPMKVYAATSKGLFRSVDGGKSYTNVNLPTGDCAGVEGGGSCQLANMVTDVVVRGVGGVNGDVQPGSVVAAVGWRASTRINSDGTVQSTGNGIYRSTTGAPGTFQKLGAGMPSVERIGRVELGEATGAAQDKDYLYAIIQDAAALNGQLDVLDVSGVPDPRGAQGTVLNGVYVSKDFGATWTLMADDNAIAKNPATGSALAVVGQALGFEPGVQAWYNAWIAPDPTRADASGVPTRLAFGLEEVWQNELNVPMNGPTPFKVIGRYFAGDSCLLLNLGLPSCPTNREPAVSNTTHPDQQEGLWIPDGTGGVTLALGNDGGFYKQHAAADEELDNGGWGDGNQEGFQTLLPYDVAMSNDGTVWAGLQDNGHMKIDPRTREQFETYGGDGTFAEVDPADPDVAYEAYVYGDMSVTTDGGKTWRSMVPPVTNPRFVNPFEMDATDANHLVTGGNEIVETTYGPETTGTSSLVPLVGDPTGGTLTDCCGEKPWTKVFDLGTAKRPGDATATPSAADPANGMSAIDVLGDAVYAGYCGVCSILNQSQPFQSGIATNVGSVLAPQRMTSNGWHIAEARGLPERFITSVAIDPADVTRKTIYVTVGGYSTRWVPPGTLQDKSSSVGTGHVFKSTDAGESFVDVSGNLPDVPATWVTLRGRQIIVGTDVGVFATDTKGRTSTYGYLKGLPVVPISSMNLKPDDPNLLVAATYGRGIWTYCFSTPLNGTVGGCPIVPRDPPEKPTEQTGTTVAGPFGFELDAQGWTASAPASVLGLTQWKRNNLFAANASTTSFAVAPYGPDSSATVASPTLTAPGGWLFVDFMLRINSETDDCGCDVLVAEYSTDGVNWRGVPWKWDPVAGEWTSQTSYEGTNHLRSFPSFSAEKVALKVPAGPVQVRFKFISDANLTTEGVYIDDVKVTS